MRCAEAGIKLPRSLIADGNYTFETGIAAAERLLDLSPRPTAIFACNDEMAAGVAPRRARSAASTFPRDLSIDRLRRHADRRAYLAAADHGALADRVDGALGGAQADRRHDRRA